MPNKNKRKHRGPQLRPRLKIAIFTLIVTLSTLAAWVLTYSKQPFIVLHNAQLQGEVEIEFLSKQSNTALASQYSLANLVDAPKHDIATKPLFGDDYVILDTRDQTLLKATVRPDSWVVDYLETFDYLLVDEDVVLSSQSAAETVIPPGEPKILPATASEQLQNVATYLGLPALFLPGSLPPVETQTVAVIDSGFYQPEAYANYIDVNQFEADGEPGKDDDYNGYVDDVYGWSFLKDSPDLTDSNGHGTHLAGLIMAVSQSLQSEYSVPVKVLPVQILDEQNKVQLSDLLQALDYAVNRDVDIINLSIGTPVESEILKVRMQELAKADIMVFAAAGNLANEKALSPAIFADVHAIGATSFDNERAAYSNYGNDVTFSFRGDLISLGERPQDQPVFLAGTSQATAVASGIFGSMSAYDYDATVRFLEDKSGFWAPSLISLESEQLGSTLNFNRLFELFSEFVN